MNTEEEDFLFLLLEDDLELSASVSAPEGVSELSPDSQLLLRGGRRERQSISSSSAPSSSLLPPTNSAAAETAEWRGWLLASSRLSELSDEFATFFLCFFLGGLPRGRFISASPDGLLFSPMPCCFCSFS